VKQLLAVAGLSLRSLPRRLGSSLVAVVGIAGVVVVLVAVLSIAEGFFAVMAGTGRPDRAMVMRGGADSETTSVLGGNEADLIKLAPGVARASSGARASSELFVMIDVPKRSNNAAALVPMRGVGPEAADVRSEFRLVEGRMFTFGTDEVVVGRAAAGQFAGLDVGAEVRSGPNRWRVVGIFETGGSVSETEVWSDARTLQGAFQRGNSYQSVLAKLESPEAFDAFRSHLLADPRLNVQVRRESEYFASQSVTMTSLIRILGFAVAGLMSLGAVFGAILTMYTAVATRAREIATLRALGFNALAVVTSVVAESLGLAAIGGFAGGLAAYLGFNGYQTSTLNFQNFSQVAFAFKVTPELLATGLAAAVVMGFAGGLLPAIRAARLPIAAALREL
jgi:putative ABC transport system permease protein